MKEIIIVKTSESEKIWIQQLYWNCKNIVYGECSAMTK